MLLLQHVMRIFRQLRGTFGSPLIHQAVLFLVAAIAATEGLGQEPGLAVPSSDLFPLDNPLRPQLPGARTSAGSPAFQEPSVLPAQSSGTKIGNGRTEITADEAAFDPDKHMATFRRNVVLKDPDFNVVCDTLVAYLKHDEPAKPGTKPARSAPNDAAPKRSVNPADDPHRTLDKAVAEMDPGGRLEITQDKVEADGTVTHSIGHGSKAVYNAVTGVTVLTGMPDATKGTDQVVATDEKTVITLMRDGGMSTVGPHKVIIVSTKIGPTEKPTPQ
jgi:lipopolysaccharide export system protein LptA